MDCPPTLKPTTANIPAAGGEPTTLPLAVPFPRSKVALPDPEAKYQSTGAGWLFLVLVQISRKLAKLLNLAMANEERSPPVKPVFAAGTSKDTLVPVPPVLPKKRSTGLPLKAFGTSSGAVRTLVGAASLPFS